VTQLNFQVSGKNVYAVYTDQPGATVIAVVPGAYRMEWLDLSTNPPGIQATELITQGPITVNVTQTPTLLTQH
jgi:hypothetical protein